MLLKWWMIASAAVILAAPDVLGLYDADAYRRAGNDATISRLSQRVAWRYPPYQWCFCFVLAVLCGHLFTTRPTPRPLPDWLSLVLFVGLPYLVVVVTLIAGLRTPGGLPVTGAGRVHPLVPILFALGLGAIVGALVLHQTGE